MQKEDKPKRKSQPYGKPRNPTGRPADGQKRLVFQMLTLEPYVLAARANKNRVLAFFKKLAEETTK
jgi:hypothetical protein